MTLYLYDGALHYVRFVPTDNMDVYRTIAALTDTALVHDGKRAILVEKQWH